MIDTSKKKKKVYFDFEDLESLFPTRPVFKKQKQKKDFFQNANAMFSKKSIALDGWVGGIEKPLEGLLT